MNYAESATFATGNVLIRMMLDDVIIEPIQRNDMIGSAKCDEDQEHCKDGRYDNGFEMYTVRAMSKARHKYTWVCQKHIPTGILTILRKIDEERQSDDYDSWQEGN